MTPEFHEGIVGANLYGRCVWRGFPFLGILCEFNQLLALFDKGGVGINVQAKMKEYIPYHGGWLAVSYHG